MNYTSNFTILDDIPINGLNQSSIPLAIASALEFNVTHLTILRNPTMDTNTTVASNTLHQDLSVLNNLYFLNVNKC